jgi:hypothetical protein
MRKESASVRPVRPSADAGIAIGPILFIIAVLGILAAAIAAGSGSFTTSTTSEGYKAKAAALIDIGQILKVGFERIQANQDWGNINIDPTDTDAAVDLFSPIGGGISPPSTTMSGTPGTDIWHYYDVSLAAMGIGTGTSPNKVAFIKVTQGVCDQINAKANAIATPTQDMGVNLAAAAPTAWPASFAGIPTGCIYNSNVGNLGYFFYQVMGVQ